MSVSGGMCERWGGAGFTQAGPDTGKGELCRKHWGDHSGPLLFPPYRQAFPHRLLLTSSLRRMIQGRYS